MHLPADVTAASSSTEDNKATMQGPSTAPQPSGIVTIRLDGAAQHVSTAPPASTLAAAANPASPQAPTAVPTPNASGKRRWMMHNEFCPLLEDAISGYHALDPTVGLALAAERTKLHKACSEDHAGALLDTTTSAAFSHQFILSLAEGARFDALKRGLALAATGRTAASAAAISDIADNVSRDNHTRLLRSQWTDLVPAFARDQELSGTHVSRLWNYVTFVNRICAARAAAWGVPETPPGRPDDSSDCGRYHAAHWPTDGETTPPAIRVHRPSPGRQSQRPPGPLAGGQ